MNRPIRRALAAALLVLTLSAGCVLAPDRDTSAPTPTATPSASSAPGSIRPDPALVGAGDPIFPALGNGGYDIENYNLDLTWAPATKTLAGTATLTATSLRELTVFNLDLTGMVVSKVEVDGAAARFVRQQSELVIAPAKPISAKSKFTVAVTYAGQPKAVPYSGGRSSDSLGWFTTARTSYTTQEPYGAHGWYPCSDHPSDKASYTITVTAPAALTVIANGKRTERKPAGASTRWSYTEATPMASYAVTLAIGTYAVTTESLTTGLSTGLPLTYAYFPADAAKALPLLRKSAAQIRYFESRFGRYPFGSYGVLATDVADDQSMETQTMVTLGRGLATDTSQLYPKGFGESILAHELAHQWFGTAVTLSRWTDMWLNEGWAQYAQAMYEADVLGQPLSAKIARYRESDRRARAEHGPPGHPKANTIPEGQVYFGPAVMMHGLRGLMGDKAFFAMAKAWVADNVGQSRSRADFTAHVAKFAGRDLSAYMAGWLDSPTQPAR